MCACIWYCTCLCSRDPVHTGGVPGLRLADSTGQGILVGCCCYSNHPEKVDTMSLLTIRGPSLYIHHTHVFPHRQMSKQKQNKEGKKNPIKQKPSNNNNNKNSWSESGNLVYVPWQARYIVHVHYTAI